MISDAEKQTRLQAIGEADVSRSRGRAQQSAVRASGEIAREQGGRAKYSHDAADGFHGFAAELAASVSTEHGNI